MLNDSKKTLLASALLLTVAIGLTGCGDTSTESPETAATPVESAPTVEPAESAAAEESAEPADIDTTTVASSAAAEDETTEAKLTTDTTGAKPYPLDVCLVSGEELGGMGDPIVMAYNGQTVKFCCSHCKPQFEADPDKYLAKLESADAATDTTGGDATADDGHEGHNH